MVIICGISNQGKAKRISWMIVAKESMLLHLFENDS